MYKLTTISALLILVLNFSAKEKGTNPLNEYTTKLNGAGIVFTENKGQVYDQNHKARPDVLYGAMAGNLGVHIKKTGVSYQLCRVDEWKEIEDEFTHEKRKEIGKQTVYRIDINWQDANTNFSQSTDETLPGYNNFYLESCPNGALNVKSYTGVTLHNLYKGIDLHYYEKNGELKHDYIVAPNVDYKQIQLKVEGASVSINKDGSLLLTTPLGKIQEGAPIVYQNGKQLKAEWKLDNNTLSFEIENHNPSHELIIDPVTRQWGTYYGSVEYDYGVSCATDAAGNVYLAGYTKTFMGTSIATAGAHQVVHNGGVSDAFLVKFNANGVRQWGTYYGEDQRDEGRSCTTDASGNVYLAGITEFSWGTAAIATAGAHQTVNGGLADGFLVKFNANGIRQWGTYYGGAGNEKWISCASDATGSVYLTGATATNTGTAIATAGAHQSVNGGGFDAFIVKFNSNGIRQWGTYYGGTDQESALSCAIDLAGNAYMGGNTSSNNTGLVIATAGAHQTVKGGNFLADAFLVKFNSNGIRQWGTYYGGTDGDGAVSCAIDLVGNVYMAGVTDSYNTGSVIATAGAHQTVNGGSTPNELDGFLVKFNANGTRLWGTYYGGAGDDWVESCATDGSGNVYLTGSTESNTGTAIATAWAHQTLHGGGISGGIRDGFLVKFDSNGIRQWGTYYGGSSFDGAYSCATDASGNIYLAGTTLSNTGTAIATAGAHQSIHGGPGGGVLDSDGFLVKFYNCATLAPSAIATPTLCEGSTINFTATISGTATPSYSWSGPNFYTSNIQNPSISNASVANTGSYTLTVMNGICVEKAIVNVVVNPSPTVIVTSSESNFICLGQSATLSASGAISYSWTPNIPMNGVISPTITTTYSVTGTDVNNCSSTATITQNVDACTGIERSELLYDISLSVFPNPTNELLNLKLEPTGERTYLEVINSLGQIIIVKEIMDQNIQLDISNYSNGIYFIVIKNKVHLIGRAKFVKE